MTNFCGVLIAFLGDTAFTVKAEVNDNNGRILIPETKIDGTENLLVNSYNANTESEQLKTLKTLSDTLKFDNFRDKNNYCRQLNLNHMMEI